MDMRRFWDSAESYDLKLKDVIRITPYERASRESHKIWEYYQAKITLLRGKIKSE